MRISGLDGLRLIAMLCVVSVHIGGADNTIEIGAWDAIRALGRWAVPFFFMLSGFFLLNPVSERAFSRIVPIWIFSNLMFLPPRLYIHGFSSLSTGFLTSGTWFHLWFVSSLIFGISILAWVDRKSIPSAILIAIATMIILGAWLADYRFTISPSGQGAMQLFRFLSALPCLYIGRWLRANIDSLTATAGLLLLAAGMTAILAQLYLQHTARAQFEMQLIPGGYVSAIGAVIVGAKISVPKLFSDLGRYHSLPIYILHPFFILVFSSYLSTAQLFAASFATSLLFSITLQKISPRIFFLLSGELRETK
ncbi:acyltransferase [Donghicola sp. C2-DW-16]|uniref:Acyltransferase n=1 Tax=Donghicola mangrovi TaxID=2729614 RepID=A0ABX2PCW7_9RHOB|nr:acyltransferase [Donghicola mangrovi]NVO27315.1 acyltransferase [Donghicola mangrovi]